MLMFCVPPRGSSVHDNSTRGSRWFDLDRQVQRQLQQGDAASVENAALDSDSDLSDLGDAMLDMSSVPDTDDGDDGMPGLQSDSGSVVDDDDPPDMHDDDDVDPRVDADISDGVCSQPRRSSLPPFSARHPHAAVVLFNAIVADAVEHFHQAHTITSSAAPWDRLLFS